MKFHSIENKKARFDYHLEKSQIAGIQLTGSEVKSIVAGKATLTDAFCFFDRNELWIKGAYISSSLSSYSHEPTRNRKLLMKKRELQKLQKSLDSGYTIIPIRIFSNERNLLKVELSLAKGKKQYDKRQSIKEREAKIEIQRTEKF